VGVATVAAQGSIVAPGAIYGLRAALALRWELGALRRFTL
jgi:hypothetical protein